MSYEIIYGKQFIKLSDNKFAPIIITGSNNCYEFSNNGRERRVRNWWNMTSETNGKHFATDVEILANIDAYRSRLVEQYKKVDGDTWSEDYSDARFGYFSSIAISGKHTSQTTFNAYRSIFVNGFKTALTIEELNAKGFSVKVQTGYDSKNILPEGSKTIYVENEQKLIESLEQLEKYVAGTNVGFYISYGKSIDGFFQSRKYENRAKKQQQTPKEKKEVTEYFVFSFDNGFFVKGTKYGFKYTYANMINSNSNKRVYTLRAAEKFLETLKSRYSYKNYTWTIEKVSLEIPILV